MRYIVVLLFSLVLCSCSFNIPLNYNEPKYSGPIFDGVVIVQDFVDDRIDKRLAVAKNMYGGDAANYYAKKDFGKVVEDAYILELKSAGFQVDSMGNWPTGVPNDIPIVNGRIIKAMAEIAPTLTTSDMVSNVIVELKVRYEGRLYRKEFSTVKGQPTVWPMDVHFGLLMVESLQQICTEMVIETADLINNG